MTETVGNVINPVEVWPYYFQYLATTSKTQSQFDLFAKSLTCQSLIGVSLRAATNKIILGMRFVRQQDNYGSTKLQTSFKILSSASSDLLWVIVHSSQIIDLHIWRIFAVAVFLATGVSIICMFSGNLKAQCVIFLTKLKLFQVKPKLRLPHFAIKFLSIAMKITTFFQCPGASRKQVPAYSTFTT